MFTKTFLVFEQPAGSVFPGFPDQQAFLLPYGTSVHPKTKLPRWRVVKKMHQTLWTDIWNQKKKMGCGWLEVFNFYLKLVDTSCWSGNAKALWCVFTSPWCLCQIIIVIIVVIVVIIIIIIFFFFIIIFIIFIIIFIIFILISSLEDMWHSLLSILSSLSAHHLPVWTLF